jgi:hypothetical protein
VLRKINRSAKSDGGEWSEVRKPGRARLNEESRDHSVGDGEKDQKKSGNHRENLAVWYDMQCRFTSMIVIEIERIDPKKDSKKSALDCGSFRRGPHPLI